MTMENAGRRIAVVGMGPRGLGALEALAECVEGSGLVIDLDIFDPVAHAGAGPNFSPDQSELCLLNLPDSRSMEQFIHSTGSPTINH